MTNILTRTRVDANGKVTVLVGEEEHGREVEVLVKPVGTNLTDEEYHAALRRIGGSIEDPTFVRPPQWPVADREPLG